MERLSIDFKGPIGNLNRNNYMLTVIDEYSRSPFAFPCSNINAETVIECLTQLFLLFGLCSCIHSDKGSAFMSKEFIAFLGGKGIAYSRTSVYNPRGNGQCEKYNVVIWSGVKLGLKSRNWPLSKWDVVLIDVLHSIRSLLCTATNTTPHERFLTFNRRSTLGTSVPSWLSSPGPVLLKRHVRTSKYDILVDEVELIQASPTRARVRLQNGREVTVSLRDVAPFGEKEILNDIGLQPLNNTELLPEENSNNSQSSSDKVLTDSSAENEPVNVSEQQVLRRSTRERRLQITLLMTMNTCANLKGGVNDVV